MKRTPYSSIFQKNVFAPYLPSIFSDNSGVAHFQWETTKGQWYGVVDDYDKKCWIGNQRGWNNHKKLHLLKFCYYHIDILVGVRTTWKQARFVYLSFNFFFRTQNRAFLGLRYVILLTRQCARFFFLLCSINETKSTHLTWPFMEVTEWIFTHHQFVSVVKILVSPD